MYIKDNVVIKYNILVPEGDQCQKNSCGENSGCRVVNGQIKCFCLPGYEGDPPKLPCALSKNPCESSPCGLNTQCTVLSSGFAKCTCLPGFIESPNTIRGCIPKSSVCELNPCGFGAVCNATKTPPCYCPDFTVGNPYKNCSGNKFNINLLLF